LKEDSASLSVDQLPLMHNRYCHIKLQLIVEKTRIFNQLFPHQCHFFSSRHLTFLYYWNDFTQFYIVAGDIIVV